MFGAVALCAHYRLKTISQLRAWTPTFPRKQPSEWRNPSCGEFGGRGAFLFIWMRGPGDCCSLLCDFPGEQ